LDVRGYDEQDERRFIINTEWSYRNAPSWSSDQRAVLEQLAQSVPLLALQQQRLDMENLMLAVASVRSWMDQQRQKGMPPQEIVDQAPFRLTTDVWNTYRVPDHLRMTPQIDSQGRIRMTLPDGGRLEWSPAPTLFASKLSTPSLTWTCRGNRALKEILPQGCQLATS
jgi:hypothetical protein